MYPSAHTRPREFVEAITQLVREHDVDFLLPVTDVSLGNLRYHSHLIRPETAFPFASPDAIELLSNKCALFRLAEDLGVPIPRTLYIDSPAEVDDLAPELTFPLVIKPSRSTYHVDGCWIMTAVTYAKDFAELSRRVEQESYLSSFPFMLQELVHGTGRGLFTLYQDGKPVVHFGHRRLREKPPAGGVSVLSESCRASESMIEASEKILGRVGWEGVAMVEFLVADDGTPYLMEVNTRFWGSLQLAIDAGVDFPYLLYRVFTGEEVPSELGFREGVRLRWLLGDLDRLYLVLRNRGGAYCLPEKMKEVIEFIRPRFGITRYEINRFGDIGPALFEARKYVTDLLRGS